MTIFLRLLRDEGKANALYETCGAVRRGDAEPRSSEVDPNSFLSVPGAPFAYWVSDSVRNLYKNIPPLESGGVVARRGVNTNDDGRFIRLFWEVESGSQVWVPHVKGGVRSPYFLDPSVVLNWQPDGQELAAERVTTNVYKHAIIPSRSEYFRPGLTWSLRTSSKITVRTMSRGVIFGSKGPAILVPNDNQEHLLAMLAVMNSAPFRSVVELQLAAADAAARAYEVGVLQKAPFPVLAKKERLATLARNAWSLKQTLDTIEETSHAFALPAALRAHLCDFDPTAIQAELVRIQTEIDAIAFGLYGFSEADRAAVQASQGTTIEGDAAISTGDEGDEEESAVPIDQTEGLLSWAAGVAFGRFDWRLATGERAAPAEPEPFDPLPAKSPGMLPDGAEPFHAHAGILVDDQGHPHDLARLVEEVLNRVDVSVPDDVRRWLRKDFFAFHLQRYSKSRRKAPIYWPLSTASGSYTLWVYYPSLNNQTLFTAVNDFLDGPNGKLTQISRECAELRIKGSHRSRDEEKQYETLQTFEQELTDLRDTLLKIAPTYQPNHDDGVQITAAPLWPLFRHKPWQKVLKDTWSKLEKGDYDWAHLAMAYWPDRVREKCKTDKSLAIAHGLEDLYVEPEAAPKKTRGKKKLGNSDE